MTQIPPVMPEKVFVDKSTFAWYDTSHLLIYQHLRKGATINGSFETFTVLIAKISRSRRIKAEEMSRY